MRHGDGEVCVRYQYRSGYSVPGQPGAGEALDDGRKIRARVGKHALDALAAQRCQEDVGSCSCQLGCGLTRWLAAPGHHLMFAHWATAVQRGISAATRWARSRADSPLGCTAIACSRSCTSGSLTISIKSLSSLLTIADGVATGANKSPQAGVACFPPQCRSECRPE